MALDRHCQSCGMLLDDAGEFHPFMFCVLKKAGRDPWMDLRATMHHLGVELPKKPPLVRNLPMKVAS